MAQMAQVEKKKGGNTKPLSKSRKYCMTVNNWTEAEYKTLITQFKIEAQKWIIGKEGADTKTQHLQIYVKYKNARSFESMKKLCGRAHIEKARGSDNENWRYCAKEQKFESNYDCMTMREKLKLKCIKEYSEIKWKDWQGGVIEELDKDPDKRKIFWYWEETGNVGKSYLCKYLALTRSVVICEGKKADIFNQVNVMIDNNKSPDIILLDIPRSSEGYINYGAIEQLKNGMLYSGKYEGGVCLFPSPHIICFANCPPDMSQMSHDRWCIKKI